MSVPSRRPTRRDKREVPQTIYLRSVEPRDPLDALDAIQHSDTAGHNQPCDVGDVSPKGLVLGEARPPEFRHGLLEQVAQIEVVRVRRLARQDAE